MVDGVTRLFLVGFELCKQLVIGGSQHFAVCGGHGGNGCLLLVGEWGEVLDTPVEGDITGYIEEDAFICSPCFGQFLAPFYISWSHLYILVGQDCLRYIQYAHVLVGHVVGGHFPGKFLIVVVCFLPFDEIGL